MSVSSEIVVGSASLTSGVCLRVHRSMGAIAGMCEIIVPTPIELTAAPGDEATAAVGIDDALESVFSGEIDAVESRGTYTVFRALDARIAAARMRVNEIFEEQTSDAIISDLADIAGIDVGDVGTGVTVVLYLADDSKTVLAHMDYLARLGGAHLFVDRDGSLQTSGFVPEPPSLQLSYGEHILDIGASARHGGGEVEVRTEGAASVQGPTAAFWPTTDTASVAGTMALGDGEKLALWRPELRSMAAALQVAATAALQRTQRARRVRLRCLGLADIELGNTVMVAGVPGADASLLLRVVAIDHRLNPWEGFVTELGLEGLGL